VPRDIPCPTPAELSQLLLGQGDPTSVPDAEAHLAGCPRCLAAIDATPAEDDLVIAVRAAGRRADPTEELVDLLVPLLKRMGTDTPQTVPWSDAPTGDAAPAKVGDLAFLAPAVEPGELGRLGRYSVREVLGAGGMGMVFRAFDPTLQRTVALKVIHPALVARPGMLDRFVQEARAAAAVEHDHLVGVFSVEAEGGVPFLTMPLLRGETLESRLQAARGPLPLADVLRIGREVATGLAAAHAAGLVHRDIKPANLWLEAPAGRVKVLDFGLAATLADRALPIAGTPGYMAPEQARGEAVGPAADLYSLGCVLWRMAVGTPLVSNVGAFTALVMAALEPAPPVASVRRDVPPALARLIDRLLDRAPTARPASAEEVARSLAELEAARTRLSRRRVLVAAGLLGAAAVGGAWLVARWLGGDGPKPVPVTFVCDAPAPKVILSQDGREVVADLAAEATHDLLPGDVAVRLAEPIPGRSPMPDRFVVPEAGRLEVRLAVVGEVARHAEHGDAVFALAVGPGPEVFTTGIDRTVVAWRPGGEPATRTARLKAQARCLALTKGGAAVVVAGGNRQPPTELMPALFDAKTLAPKGEPLAGHTRIVNAVAFAPDGKRLLSAARGEAWLWDLATGDRTPLGTEAGVFAADFTADGANVVTGDDAGQAAVWDAATGKPVRSFDAHKGTVRAVRCVAGGFLTAGDDGRVRAWELATGAVREVGRHEKAALCLAVTTDGQWAASGGIDGGVVVWSVADAKVVYKPAGHAGAVHGVGFTPDGRRLATGGADRVVRLWQLPFRP